MARENFGCLLVPEASDIFQRKKTMLDYKSMSNEELRRILAEAGAELLSRRAETVPVASKQHSYRIAMPRTSKAEPEAFRFTPVDGLVIRIPLLLDQLVGKTGRLIGGEFLLDDGDVIQKIYASGMVLYLIVWQGNLDRQDYDVSKVLEGEKEAETIAKIAQFVRGDPTLIIQELTKAISAWREQVAEYQEMGKTDQYWKELAKLDRQCLNTLEGMLSWARSRMARKLESGARERSVEIGMRQSPDGGNSVQSISVPCDRAGRMDEPAATTCDRVST
jgi:hypothetical protein